MAEVFGLARYSTLFVALLIASPALYAGFVTHELGTQTALIRLLIAVPVAAIMLGLFRMITRGYGKEQRKPATAGEAVQPGAVGGDPLRAEAVAGEPFPHRRAEEDGSR